jgi:predicted DNA-binding transcriptional regulator
MGYFRDRVVANLLLIAAKLAATAVCCYALRHPGHPYTVKSHSLSHNVVSQTARTDLTGLVERGLLEKRKVGKGFVYYPAEDLSDKLKNG